MSDHEFIRTEARDGLLELTLSRPPLNILNGPMMDELTRAFAEAERNREAKLLLLRAEGKVFSAGADIDEHRPGKAEAMIESFHGMFRALHRVPCPTVAYVHGAALGGGCELAMGFDMVLAEERAKFGQPEIGLGFLPPVAAALLPGISGWSRAVELCCSGRPWTAHEALANGLVLKVFTSDEAEEGLKAFLAPFLQRSPLILRLVKKALRGGDDRGFSARLDAAERIFLEELMATQDVREGLAAFDEKREPDWKNE